jgi:hypothetical protein
MSHVLPWLRRPPSSQDATPPPQASVKSAQPFALHPELPPTTAALYGTYAAVLATIVFLSWSINRKLAKRRSRSQAEPWLMRAVTDAVDAHALKLCRPEHQPAGRHPLAAR